MASPDRHGGHPSTSNPKLSVSEDDGEDQPCPDDAERLKQQQLLCGEALNTKEKLSFTPELLTESGKTSYRFRCPGPGVFQCALTGLVFVVAQEAELLYRTVQWDESLLQSAGKTAAGLLFSIECPENAVCQLHLPHCETKDALLPDGLLSVVHITDDGMSILDPLEITDTHVVVKVPHLSAFGLVWDIVKRLWTTPVCGQVLLFLGPPNTETQRQQLKLFLLPSNIHLDEVNKRQQQRHAENIEVPSTCILIADESYTVDCPQAIKIQPKNAPFKLQYGPNYHPTFEIRLPTNTEEVTIKVQDQRKSEVWEHAVDLKESKADFEIQNSVSEPVLNQLLDRLLQRGIINQEEMDSARTKTRADGAGAVIDMVRNKGTEASSALIEDFSSLDPHCSQTLNLS